jgi:hypothetical protein
VGAEDPELEEAPEHVLVAGHARKADSELHLPTAIVSGRADVILDVQGGELRSLAIVDYKTSADPAAVTTTPCSSPSTPTPGGARACRSMPPTSTTSRPPTTSRSTASEQTVESSVAELRQQNGAMAASGTTEPLSKTRGHRFRTGGLCGGRRPRQPAHQRLRAAGQKPGTGTPASGHAVDAPERVQWLLDHGAVGDLRPEVTILLRAPAKSLLVACKSVALVFALMRRAISADG